MASDPHDRLHVGGTFHRVERTTALDEVFTGEKDGSTKGSDMKSSPLLWEGDNG